MTSDEQTSTVVLSQNQAKDGQLKYVALGDSYSAGAGTAVPEGKYEPVWWRSTTHGFDAPDLYRATKEGLPIHSFPTILPSKRNHRAWPVKLSKMGVALRLVDFRASTGAETIHVTKKPQDDRTKMAQLAGFSNPDSVDVVTITIGGNDVGFATLARSCVMGKCDQDLLSIGGKLESLTNLYNSIQSTFSNAMVYVVGYPHVDPPRGATECKWNLIAHPADDKDWKNIRNFTIDLNREIQRHVSKVDSPRLKFVDITREDFPGYYCSSESMLVPILEAYVLDESLVTENARKVKGIKYREDMCHQNDAGMTALAVAVSKALRGTKSLLPLSFIAADNIETSPAGHWLSGGGMCSAHAMTNLNIRAKHKAKIPDACPKSDVYEWKPGVGQNFEGGKRILSLSDKETYLLEGEIGNYIFNNISKVGNPASDAYDVPGGKAQKTEKTIVYWHSSTGLVNTIPPPVAASKVVINIASASIKVGNTLTLRATVSPATAKQSVTWSSSNTAVATVSSSGVVTGKAASATAVTISAKANNGVTGTAKITVTTPPPVCTWYKPTAAVQQGIQQGLKNNSLYSGPTDGVWGPKSISGIQQAVKKWQGYKGRTDGVYKDTETCKAIQTFARKGGYTGPIDGILGPNSWNGFLKALPKPPPVCTWYTPTAAVQQGIQQALKNNSLYGGLVDGKWGQLSISGIQKAVQKWQGYTGRTDGVYAGTDTCKAVQNFAKNRGGYAGPIDGILGPNSWNGFLNGLPKPQPTPVCTWYTPTAAVQQGIQQGLRNNSLYSGPLNGAWNQASISGIQKAVQKWQGYAGRTDGVYSGTNTCKAIQEFAKSRGGYAGPIDGVLGPNSWNGFLNGLPKPPPPPPPTIPSCQITKTCY